MRISIALSLVVSIALNGGCGATYSGARTQTFAGGIILIGGLAIGAQTVTAESQREVIGINGLAIAFGLLCAGVALGSTGLIGMAVYDDPATEQKVQAPTAEERAEEMRARERHEQCVESRASLLLDAQSISDAQTRARALRSVPACGAPPAFGMQSPQRVQP